MACNDSPVAMSICKISAVLAHIDAEYDQIGGGGIASVTIVEPDVVVARVPQEGRVDVLTFTLNLDDPTAVTVREMTYAAD